MEKQNIDVQPIIYRLTQETVLNPTTIKSATHLTQQTVPSNINDNDTSDAAVATIVTDSISAGAAVAAVANKPQWLQQREMNHHFYFLICPLIWQLTNYLCAT